MQLVELRYGGTIEDLLRERIERGMSLPDIAAEWGLSTQTICVWIDRLGGVRTLRFRSDTALSGTPQ